MKKVRSRAKNILKILLSAQEPLTSTKISKMIGVTDRTVKNDIKEISEFLYDYGAEVQGKTGSGYSVVIKDEELFNLLDKKMKMDNVEEYKNIPQTKIQRINYIVMKLLTIDYALNIDDLAEELYVEKSTVMSCLKPINTLLNKYKLSLFSNGKEGIIIEGSEIHKRICASEFFFHNRDFEEFNAEDNAMFNSTDSKREIRKIKEILLNVLKKYDIQLSAFSIENMSIHIFVALRRWTLYNYAKVDDGSAKLVDGLVELTAAKHLVKDLEKEYNIMLPPDEASYFALHLKSKRINIDNSGFSNQEDKKKLEVTLENIFAQIEKRYSYSFSGDSVIEKYLFWHIKALIERLQIGFSVRADSASFPKSENLLAYRFAQIAIDTIKKNYDLEVDENERSFLIIYFNLALYRKNMQKGLRIAVANGSGRPEGLLLLNQITLARKNLPDVIEIIEPSSINKQSESKYDAIISNSKINYGVELPTIYLPIGKNVDADEMQRLLDLAMISKNHKSAFSESRFYDDVKTSDKGNILECIEEALVSKNEKTEASLVKDCNYYEIGHGCVMLFSKKQPNHLICNIFHLKKPMLLESQISTVVWIDGPKQETEKVKVYLDFLSSNIDVFDGEYTYKKLKERTDKQLEYLM